MWFIGIFVRVVYMKLWWIELFCLDDLKIMFFFWKIIYKKNYWILFVGVLIVRFCEEVLGIIIWNWILFFIKI